MYEEVKEKFKKIESKLIESGSSQNQEGMIKLSQEHAALKRTVDLILSLEKTNSHLEQNRQIINEEQDPELRQMAEADLNELELKAETLKDAIEEEINPSSPNDRKNAIIEIRAGAGGDEAALFAGDLFRMYARFCEKKSWKLELIDASEIGIGGYKEIICKVTGHGVYGILKYESGVHRVQRVPQTETQGRIHTSAATVAVLPEAEEFDVVVNQNDIKKETFCSSGPGGQSVNTTYSAVRLTHIPTGIVVSCQDEKSQIKNNEKAMNELRTRIYNMEYQKHIDKIAAKRKTMVSSGDRSAKIRTYNWSQNRVTDHRINLTLYNLDAIINGDISELISKLQMAENAEKLKESGI